MNRTSDGAAPRFRPEQLQTVSSSKPATREPITPDTRFTTCDWRYKILSVNNRVLGDAATLHEALDKFNSWAQSAAIVLGSYVVHTRKGGVR